jgi:hypothetical protein
MINPLNAEINPICHLLAFAAAPYIYDISRLRVNIQAPWVFTPSTSKGLQKFQWLNYSEFEDQEVSGLSSSGLAQWLFPEMLTSDRSKTCI